MPLPTNLFIFNLAYIIRINLNLWSNLSYINLLSIFYTTFYQTKMILILFFHHVTCTNPTLLLDAMLHALILHLSFFYTLYVAYIPMIPSHKSNMINSFGIIMTNLLSSILTLLRFILLRLMLLLQNVTCNNIRV